MGNLISNFCVSVWVRVRDAANFSQASKDAPENFATFDTDIVLVAVGQVWFGKKTDRKFKITGVNVLF